MQLKLSTGNNTISASDWASNFEAYGAVFLPAAGYRDGSVVDDVGGLGYYWFSIPHDEDGAYSLTFGESGADVGYDLRYYGQSVRLVR